MRQVDIPKHILRRQVVRLRRRPSRRLRLRFLIPAAAATSLPFLLLRLPSGERPVPELPAAQAAVRPSGHGAPRPTPAAPTAASPAPGSGGPAQAPPPKNREVAGALADGSSLLAVLQGAGLSRDALFELLAAAGKVIDFRRCRPGDRYRLIVSPEGQPLRLEYYGATPEVLGATRRGGKLTPLREPLRGERSLRVLRGRIDRSLEAAVVAAGGTPTLAANLADLFAWDIDVNVDPRRGDAFAIALTRVRLPDGSWREGAIQAAEYRGAAGRFRAYRFRDGARPAYFDERARPLKRRYLASPLPFVRITSKFGRRWHPILARPSHHGGIDYAAPRGTPAWAVADGRVEFAGHNGGYGKLVILRHPDGMRSYYAHLSRIAKVMRRGARVGQKQVVGYVGTTGLSTGPHLHFAMRQGGRFVDPAKARGRRAAPLPPAKARDFRRLVAQLDTRMRGTEVAAR